MSIDFKPHVKKIEKIITIKEAEETQDNNWDDYKKTLSLAKKDSSLSELVQSLLKRISLLENWQESYINNKDTIKERTQEKISIVKTEIPHNISKTKSFDKKIDKKFTNRIDITTFDWSSLNFWKSPKFNEGIKNIQEWLNGIKWTRLHHNLVYSINKTINNQNFSLAHFKSAMIEITLILKNFSKDKKNHADIKTFFNLKDQKKSEKLLKELIKKDPKELIEEFDAELSTIHAQVEKNKILKEQK